MRAGGAFRARFFASEWEGSGFVEVCNPPQRVLVRLSTRGGASRVTTLLRLEELKPASPLPLEPTR